MVVQLTFHYSVKKWAHYMDTDTDLLSNAVESFLQQRQQQILTYSV